MQNKIFTTLHNHITNLKSKYPIQSLAIFGSATKVDFDPISSDIDILVDYTSEDFNLFYELGKELEQLLHYKVDLITKRSLKPRQWEYIKPQLRYV